MAKKQLQCPQCGRLLLTNGTGRIGKCLFHRVWHPIVPDAAEEAAHRNEAERQAREKRRQQKEDAKQRTRKEREQLRSKAARSKLMAAVAAIAVCAALAVVFVVLPNANYQEAKKLVDAGQYAEALPKLQSLGERKDVPLLTELCEGVLSLTQGDAAQSLTHLDALNAAGRDDLANELRTHIQSALKREADGEDALSAQEVLALLPLAAGVDAQSLAIAAQLELNPAEQHALLDIDENGADELILRNSSSLTALRVRTGEELVLNADQSAAAWRALAQQSLDAGDADNALHSARQAVAISNDTADFDRWYTLALASCGEDIARWDALCTEESSLIAAHNAAGRARLDAGTLRLNRAKALAAAADAACIPLFREAQEHGVDTASALLSAADAQQPGLLKTQLRLEAIDLLEPAARQAQNTLLAREMTDALSRWQALSIPAGDVMTLLSLTQEHGIAHTADSTKAYQSAAIALADLGAEDAALFLPAEGTASQLLTADGDGTIRLMRFTTRAHTLSTHESGLTSPQLRTIPGYEHLLMATSSTGGAFAVLTTGETGIISRLKETGVAHIRLNEDGITYQRSLAGSIDRGEGYRVSLPGLATEATGIVWQQDAYPYPETAAEALLRWFEARAYRIAPEQTLLTTGADYPAAAFLHENLSDVPPADDITAITISPIDVQQQVTLLEAAYTSAGGQIRALMAVRRDGAHWQVCGANATFADAAFWAADHTEPALPLNESVTANLASAADQHIYRVLITQQSMVQLVWQSGSKTTAKGFQVALYRSDDAINPVFYLNMTQSPASMHTTPTFLAPGVYYLHVTPGKHTADPYTVQLLATHNTRVEAEDNNTLATANAITLGEEWTAALQSKDDVDCFLVTVPENGKLTLTLTTKPGSRSGDRYTAAVANVKDLTTALTWLTVADKAETASTGAMYVSAGQYLIQVSRASVVNAAAYSIRADFEAAENTEYEPNNTAATANAIPVNQAITGVFGAAGDVDYYAITLEGDSLLQPYLDYAAAGTSSRVYELTLMQGADTLAVWKYTGRDSMKEQNPLALPAGTYTVKLTNPNHVHQPYKLRMTAQPIELAELEPNNVKAQSTPLTIGKTITGILHTADDVDCYHLTLTEQMVLTFDFQFASSATDGSVFTIRIDQGGQKVQTLNVKGSDLGCTHKWAFPAGEYDITIKPYNAWQCVPYTLVLK